MATTSIVAATSDVEKIFQTIVNNTIGEEGGYSNDPNDSGGETMWGITVAEARALGYTGAMDAMPRDTAVGFYRILDWQQPGFDQIASISPVLAYTMMDLGVNMGTYWPGYYLQRGLNVMSNNGTAWSKILVDGSCGALTRAALKSYLAARGADGERVMMNLIHALAAERYVTIAETTPTDAVFEYGWLSNRAFPATDPLEPSS